jgi:hypothetical protein
MGLDAGRASDIVARRPGHTKPGGERSFVATGFLDSERRVGIETP